MKKYNFYLWVVACGVWLILSLLTEELKAQEEPGEPEKVEGLSQSEKLSTENGEKNG